MYVPPMICCKQEQVGVQELQCCENQHVHNCIDCASCVSLCYRLNALALLQTHQSLQMLARTHFELLVLQLATLQHMIVIYSNR
jgi:hypothetical protein